MKTFGLLAVAAALSVTIAGAASARSQATEIDLTAAMNPQEERPTPRGDVANARGTFTASATKSGAGATLAWRLAFSNLSGPANAAHIHTAPRGEPGPVVVPLCAPCTDGQTGTANVSAAVLAAIQSDRAYVNVHTTLNPPGEIRGQLTSVATTRVAMNARQERPRPRGTVARARGQFAATVTKQGDTAVVAWRLTFSRLTGRAVAAHIHRGQRGRSGPVIVALCTPCRSGTAGRANVSAAVLSALETGRAYVNVHTRRNPQGEIRGQIPALALTIT